MSRQENQIWTRWIQARTTTRKPYPEPETTELYKAILTASGRILWNAFNVFEPSIGHAVASKVILEPEKFQGKSLFSTWLYRVVRNTFLMACREARLGT